MVCHTSPLWVPSWHSSLVLSLRTDPFTAWASALSPHSLCVNMSMCESLLSWILPFSTISVVNFLHCASLCSLLSFLSSSLTSSVRRFPVVWKFHPQVSLLRTCSPSPNPLTLFSALPFALPYSEEISLPIYMSGVLCQHWEVVLWELLQVDVIFWSICGRKDGLPVLFLLHLRTAPPNCNFLRI